MVYTVGQFIGDAKSILRAGTGESELLEVGERMKKLALRDDLDRLGLHIGPSDASSDTYALHMEPGNTMLLAIAQFTPGYCSPVHNHGVWIVACGYRGVDVWSMYERLDDGSRDGYAELRKLHELPVSPGKVRLMPEPPRDIHSHENRGSSDAWEMVFFGTHPDMSQ